MADETRLTLREELWAAIEDYADPPALGRSREAKRWEARCRINRILERLEGDRPVSYAEHQQNRSDLRELTEEMRRRREGFERRSVPPEGKVR